MLVVTLPVNGKPSGGTEVRVASKPFSKPWASTASQSGQLTWTLQLRTSCRPPPRPTLQIEQAVAWGLLRLSEEGASTPLLAH